jgi:elongation factor P
VIEKTLHQSDVLQEASVTKREVKYLYSNRGEFWFCEPNNPKERFSLPVDVVGDIDKYVSENSLVEAIEYDDAIMSVSIPIKVELKVKEAPDAVKGNTSSGATKEVLLETGHSIFAPMFINQGDIISVNTDSGLYSERIEKA